MPMEDENDIYRSSEEKLKGINLAALPARWLSGSNALDVRTL
jgi:hypothetical protein